MSSSFDSWDFIIVGSGPSGSALAWKLASAPSNPRILLLEAGAPKDDRSLLVSGKRWTTFQNKDMNWGYTTTPQSNCAGRQIDYSRGKVLGGSSAINFGVYTVGARDDYDTWAEKVGDDVFSWKEIQRRFKDIESFDAVVKDERYKRFVSPDMEHHGSDGPLKVGYAKEWEDDLPPLLEAFQDAGVPLNGDHNSGDPIGLGLCINSVSKGCRSTARDLINAVTSGNLEVKTGKPVRRVVLDGTRAVGVEVDGEIFYATKEVILSAGSLDTPRILMHSGLGPASQLSSFNIPIIKDIPAIGQNLVDHFFVPLIFARKPDTNDRTTFYGDQAAIDAATTQWNLDGTGPWSKYGSQLTMGWLKSPSILASSEFTDLPGDVQDFLNKPTIPHFEIASHFPVHMLSPPGAFKDYSYLCLLVFLMNEQSKGCVTLQSSDPDVPLLFNPNVLGHPYDRRACIEATREVLRITRHDSFEKDTVDIIVSPASESEDDILKYWSENCSSSWHMSGTVKMGNGQEIREGSAAVDSRFRLSGPGGEIQGLRVADMSVVPVLTNNHTQATAYVTGVTAAEVLIGEYGL
ncbi:oxidoreductase [Aspergillus filifer]